MEVILLARNAEVTDALRDQAHAAVERIATRLKRVANAVVRFIGDGPTRRVIIVLRADGHGEFSAQADARSFAPALQTAAQRLETQLARSHRPGRAWRSTLRTGELPA